jgi:long-chain acyl-CoA synthetase
MTLQVPYRSVPDLFRSRVAQTPHARALGYPTPDGGAAWYTWAEVDERATAIAAGLLALGVHLEDRVAILASTRVEWILADFGVMCAGAATTTVYPTTSPEEATYIVADSGSKVLIAEDAEQAAKVASLKLAHVVVMDGPAPDGAITLAQLEDQGRAALAEDAELVERAVAALGPEHLATLIYTSGTTGRPKGVELLQGGWAWESVAQDNLGVLLPTDIQLLWLPLSHSFGKTLICGLTHVGLPTYVDGRVDKLMDNLATVKPSLLCAAPRVFEKVYNAVVTSGTAAGGLKARIFRWAIATGRRAVRLEQAGQRVPAMLAAQRRLAHGLVYSKLHARLGGNIRVLVSGAAPLSPDIAEFFAAVGLPILEGYGMTESSAANFVNRPDRLKIGTVGLPLGDLEVKLDEDGEVLLRGIAVMRGYHNMPEETAAAFTEDGFLRTGDIGELDADGFLRITDRKKDLIKTSGGKYVAPSHIEGLFKALCPYTSQVLLVGQSRNFCTLLISLDPDALRAWAAGGPLAGSDYATLAASDEVRAMVQGYVDQLNRKLNRWETIKKFAVLPRDLSVEDGDLTPSMKIKRRAVEKNFAAQIDQMYAGTLVS